jgi:hypothetical protein
MRNLVTVQAGWAIWSKRPGTRDDYSVLAASTGPLSTAEFGSVLAHFAPGNPPAEAGTPSSLPWVTFNRVGVAEQTYVGASLQLPTEHVDGAGRPVSRTSYLCVPYEDFARRPVSYRALYEALKALPTAELPSADGGPVPLTLSPLDPAELARDILDFGADMVAVTAAMLLSGPVTVTGPDFPAPETRVRFLDAVAALLPYGYRASFTAASWSDTGAGARFRIVFANRARDEASRLTWRMTARVPEGPARRYLDYLKRVTGRSAVDAGELARLIGHLAADIAPGKFERPAQALASLGEFFQAVLVVEDADAGTVNLAEIRRLFANGRDRELPAGRRRELFGYLIAAGDEQDWRLISERFSSVSDSEPRALVESMARAGRTLIWTRGTRGLMSRYLRLAGQYGLADELLAQVISGPAPPASPDDGLEAAGALLAEFVIVDAAGPAAYHRTQQALAKKPGAGAALLAHLCDSEPGTAKLGAAVEWLEPVLDGVLPSFNAVLGDHLGSTIEPVSAEIIDALNRSAGQSSVRLLLNAASRRGRLGLVLPGLARWLAREATRQGRANREYWGAVAMQLRPVRAAEGAWLDLALLSVGDNPRSLFTGRFGHQEFARALASAWGELVDSQDGSAEAGQAVDEALVSALVDSLGRHPWRETETDTAIVSELVTLLCGNDARPRLKGAVLDPLQALSQLSSRATSDQVAEICARAYTNRLRAEQIGEALAKSGAIRSGEQAADVLDRLHRELPAGDRETSYQWEGALAKRFADGTFGEQTAADFARCLVRRARTEIAYQVRLVGIAAGGEGTPLSVLTDADADSLDRAEKDLNDVLKRARKRQGGLFSWRKDLKEGDE